MRTESTAKLLRIFLGESDRWEGRPLHLAIVEEMRMAGLAGATTLKGVLGFGGHSVIHKARILSLSSDLPVMVEAVDTEEKIEAFLPTLDRMVIEGLVTIENVSIIAYKSGAALVKP
jgi:PII-like signaling protein